MINCVKKKAEEYGNTLEINYTKRNSVFEKFLFEGKIISEVPLMERDFNRILEVEQTQLFNITDSVSEISKIKTIEKIAYNYKFGVKSDEGVKLSLVSFNKKGRIEKRINYDNIKSYYSNYETIYEYASDTLLKSIVEYNFLNKIFEITTYDYSSSNNIININNKINFIYLGEIYPKSDNYNLSEIIREGQRNKKLREKLQIEIFGNIKERRNAREWIVVDTDESFLQNNKDSKKSFRYNKSGKRIEMIDWNQNGNVDKKTIYTYDSLENLIEAKFYKFDENKLVKFNLKDIELIYLNNSGNIEYKTIYRFDDKFNLAEVFQLNKQNNLNWKNTIVYNKLDYRTEEILFNWDLSINKKIQIKCNENNQIICKSIFKGDKELVNEIRYNYDSLRLLTEELIFNKSNEQISKKTLKYNSRGNIMEITEYDNLNEPVKATNYIYEYY